MTSNSCLIFVLLILISFLNPAAIKNGSLIVAAKIIDLELIQAQIQVYSIGQNSARIKNWKE